MLRHTHFHLKNILKHFEKYVIWWFEVSWHWKFSMSNYLTYTKQLESLKKMTHHKQSHSTSTSHIEWLRLAMTQFKIGCTLVKKTTKTNNNAWSSKNIHGHETCCKTTSQSASKLRAAVSLLGVNLKMPGGATDCKTKLKNITPCGVKPSQKSK